MHTKANGLNKWTRIVEEPQISEISVDEETQELMDEVTAKWNNKMKSQ